MSEQSVMTVAEFNKAADAWGKKGATWVKEGHKLALVALLHLKNHGDIGPVNRLYCAMPKGSKSSAMATWLMSYGALRANEDTSDKAKPFVYAKDKTTNPEDAAKTPWYEFRPEPTPLALFSTIGAIEAMIKRAATAATVEDSGLLEKVKELVAEYKEAQANAETPADEQSETPAEQAS